jgi:ubiquinone biosynthesis protein COQ9
MIDLSTPKGRLIAAAMRLADTRPWAEITLIDIAEAAGVSLADLKTSVASKPELIAAFMTAVDDAVVKSAVARDVSQPPRDRLFEVIMGRFDLLMPYKTALKSIAAGRTADPGLIRPFLASQHWMLQAAGIGTDGTQGTMRVLGLGSLYAAIFQTWLNDDDPGMAKTMASLDRRLRRGEQTLTTIEDTVSGVMRFAANLPGLVSAAFGRGRSGDQSRQGGNPPSHDTQL